MKPLSTQFTLSREYLAECFDESLPHGKNARPNFWFPAILFAAGTGLLFFTEQRAMVGIIFIVLAVIELLHIRFRRAWWLARQMWGASANSEVTLTIDEAGIQTQSPYTQTMLLWSDIDRIVETEFGHILVPKAGAQQYLSKSLFADGQLNKMLEKYK